GIGDGVEAFFRVRCHHLGRRCQQIGVGLVVRATHTPAQLVQLGEAKLVGAFDDDGVGTGNVDAGFDDGGAHQYVEATVVEVAHDALQLALVHLPVGGGDARVRQPAAQFFGGGFHGVDVVVQEVHLT